jgi:hypothetical protein
LPLTDLISQAQAYERQTPWLRAKPVMLDSAMAANTPGRESEENARRT